MLFLRVTPTLPNTFINVASPIVDVPYHTFLLATFIGLIPAAYVTVRVFAYLFFFSIMFSYLLEHADCLVARLPSFHYDFYLRAHIKEEILIRFLVPAGWFSSW